MEFAQLPGGRGVQFLSHVPCVIELMSASNTTQRGVHDIFEALRTFMQARLQRREDSIARREDHQVDKSRCLKVQEGSGGARSAVDEDTAALFTRPTRESRELSFYGKSPRVQHEPTSRTSHRASSP